MGCTWPHCDTSARTEAATECCGFIEVGKCGLIYWDMLLDCRRQAKPLIDNRLCAIVGITPRTPQGPIFLPQLTGDN